MSDLNAAQLFTDETPSRAFFSSALCLETNGCFLVVLTQGNFIEVKRDHGKSFFFLLISHSFVYIKNTVRGPNLVQQLVTSGPAGVHQSIKEFNFCVKTDKWGDIFPTKTKTTIIYTVYIYIYPWGIRFFTGQQRKITEHWC